MYRLAKDEDGVYCTCPDYEQREKACKHAVGLEYRMKRERTAKTIKDGMDQRHAATNGHVASGAQDRPAPEPEKQAVRRIPETNPAPPTATSPRSTLYNAAQAAQENESQHFIRLVWDLAKTVPQERQALGRKWVDIQKVIYGIIHRVYTTKSERRSFSYLRIASDLTGFGEMPSRPTLTRYMESPSLTPILTHRVEVSAVPVSPLETGFAIDSTGFGTNIRDEQWADAMWGTAESK